MNDKHKLIYGHFSVEVTPENVRTTRGFNFDQNSIRNEIFMK